MESSSKASDIEENLISHHDEHSEQSSSISGDCDMQESHKEKLAEKVCVEEQKVISSQMQDDFWICAICLDTICIEELAQIKGCEHAYWCALGSLSTYYINSQSILSNIHLNLRQCLSKEIHVVKNSEKGSV
eukprot:TRINITY_DN5788_c0_g2_i1.p1 TRINITY_DN5788_c0_g2~~TRINITY_DN5788_c0_g2_i1.p1  ORF type:complete len:132 (+),score=26.72 TRINITY_DN5788_c0_g2_i1:577-972(+)